MDEANIGSGETSITRTNNALSSEYGTSAMSHSLNRCTESDDVLEAGSTSMQNSHIHELNAELGVVPLENGCSRDEESQNSQDHQENQKQDITYLQVHNVYDLLQHCGFCVLYGFNLAEIHCFFFFWLI